MRALVYEGPGKPVLRDKPKPVIVDPTDAIVRITKTTICGTDLHILKGDVPSCRPGTTLGHEGVGVIEQVGTAVRGLAVGDAVLISCITSCGRCDFCRKGMYSHCRNGGWILGNAIDGTQAEFVRIPHADTSLHRVPADCALEALVMLSDILPTGFECGVLNGKVAPGSVVAIVGAGPIGLAALMTAQFYSPSMVIMVDIDPHRLEVGLAFGATHAVCATDAEAARQIMALTGGEGVDTAIEAVGIASTFELCQEIIAPGGTIANVGVHGHKADLHLEHLWSRNITITTRLVDTQAIPQLMNAMRAGRLDAAKLITHRFTLDAIEQAYATFGDAAASAALKVIISND
jgi:alcohol dehydrogenase